VVFEFNMMHILVVGAMSDDRRANLEVCWRMAEKAAGERDRRAWLEMATSWKLLIAIGDPAITDGDSVGIRHSPRLADRIVCIARSWFIQQLELYIPRSCFHFYSIWSSCAGLVRGLDWSEKFRFHFSDSKPRTADRATPATAGRTLQSPFGT
jgi:hypothetical protein